MLTYKLQAHDIHLEGAAPALPWDYTIALRLQPLSPFGAGTDPTRIIPTAHPYSAQVNMNTGRTVTHVESPIPRLALDLPLWDGTISFDGNSATFRGQVNAEDSFNQQLAALNYLLPGALSLYLLDPFEVSEVTGTLNGIPFRWQHRRVEAPITFTAGTAFATRTEEAVRALEVIGQHAYRRVAAAVTYFHTAIRLLTVGTSAWEFMAEVLLNLAKALEALFGPERDKIRAGLRQVGFPPADVEGIFIPITLLRAQFDVAHARLAIIQAPVLARLYSYLSGCEDHVRVLLTTTLAAIRAGTFTPVPSDNLYLSPAENAQLEQLIQSLSTAGRAEV